MEELRVSGSRLAPDRPGQPVHPETHERLLRLARERGGRLEAGGLRIRLAESFGFCQGVPRAVELALDAARASGPRLFVTGEIIHNPAINEELRRAGALLLPPAETPGRFAGVGPEDRVIIPAFGTPRAEEQELARIGCTVIDTTCGWVRRVWRAAGEFASAGLTVVIHGRAEHEETRATASRVPGPWIVARDVAAAEDLARFVGAGPGERVAGWPSPTAASPGFDPGRDLDRLGLVNQTTMLSGETERIAAILRAALRRRWGAEPGPDRFRALDTFCPATQRRQDAVRRLIERGEVGRLIVVGGFRSSNTAHLARLGAERVPGFHVEDATCLIDRDSIRHLPPGASEPVVTRGWLPEPPGTIGVSAGASTPDRETGSILARLLELCGPPAEGPR
jgi:4-hydroxy-3-methylbut-2-enyl diphosphate reductase